MAAFQNALIATTSDNFSFVDAFLGVTNNHHSENQRHSEGGEDDNDGDEYVVRYHHQSHERGESISSQGASLGIKSHSKRIIEPKSSCITLHDNSENCSGDEYVVQYHDEDGLSQEDGVPVSRETTQINNTAGAGRSTNNQHQQQNTIGKGRGIQDVQRKQKYLSSDDQVVPNHTSVTSAPLWYRSRTRRMLPHQPHHSMYQQAIHPCYYNHALDSAKSSKSTSSLPHSDSDADQWKSEHKIRRRRLRDATTRSKCTPNISAHSRVSPARLHPHTFKAMQDQNDAGLQASSGTKEKTITRERRSSPETSGFDNGTIDILERPFQQPPKKHRNIKKKRTKKRRAAIRSSGRRTPQPTGIATTPNQISGRTAIKSTKVTKMYQDGDGECVQRFDHQPKQSSRDRCHSAGGDGVWSSAYKQRVIPIQRNDPDLGNIGGVSISF